MNPELALQRLNETKDVVDEEIGELVDAVARLIILQQDVAHPMYGAKVTYVDIAADKVWEEGPEGEREGKWVVDDEVDFYDPDGYPVKTHRAIVFEPGVHSAGDGETEFWDPNREEWKLPSEYPMGSVNVIYGDEGRPLTEEYNSSVREATSVVPANDPKHPERYSYVPGWDTSLPTVEETTPDELPWED